MSVDCARASSITLVLRTKRGRMFSMGCWGLKVNGNNASRASLVAYLYPRMEPHSSTKQTGAVEKRRWAQRDNNARKGQGGSKKFNVIKLRLFIFTQVHWTLSVSYLVISLRVWHLCGARVRSCAAYHERAHVYVHACALRCVFACARARAQASISLGGGLLGWLVAAGVEM